MQHEIYVEKKFFSWLHVNLCGHNIYFPIFFKTFLRALVCKNQTNPKFRGKGEKFDFFLILILDRQDYN